MSLLKPALEKGRLSLRQDRQLVFLCGANEAPGRPSRRRRDLITYLHRRLPETRVVLAEGIFAEMKKHGSEKNVLDIEHRATTLADKIVIVLESASAFCELGAFAHPELRPRLIVINDKKFATVPSFINEGPIAAIREVSKANVVWYAMGPLDPSLPDGIGHTFSRIEALLKTPRKRAALHVLADCHPDNSTKAALFFAHDLILLLGPLTHSELMDAYKYFFGKGAYDSAKQLLGILKEAELIRRLDTDLAYRSVAKRLFFDFPSQCSSLIAASRAYHLRTNPARFPFAKSA